MNGNVGLTEEEKVFISDLKRILDTNLVSHIYKDHVPRLIAIIDSISRQLIEEKRGHDLARSHSEAWKNDWEVVCKELAEERKKTLLLDKFTSIYELICELQEEKAKREFAEQQLECARNRCMELAQEVIDAKGRSK